MFEPDKPMSWFYYVTIAFFLLYVLYSLYYMIKRTYALRLNTGRLDESSHQQRARDLASQTESIEDMMERVREDGKARAFRIRQLMNAFDYEVYSEDTTISTVPLVQESFREGGEDDKDGDVETGAGKKRGARRTTLVLQNNAKKLPKRGSKRCLKKCASNLDGSSRSNDAESLLVNGSVCTNITEKTAIIPDGDESTTALSRKLDKEAEGLEPECVICLEPYKYGQVICSAKIESCGHIFHADCMQQWIKENEECPLCRIRIVFQEEQQGQQTNL